MTAHVAAPILPGRPVPPTFRKVHDFADILDINRQNKDKMIKLPERYRYLPEHVGAIRATVLAGLQQLPQGPVIAPPQPAVPGAQVGGGAQGGRGERGVDAQAAFCLRWEPDTWDARRLEGGVGSRRRRRG